MKPTEPQAIDWFEARCSDKQFTELKAKYDGLRVATDEEILTAIGATHLLEGR